MSKSGVTWKELPVSLRVDVMNKLVMLSPLPAQSLSSCLSSLHRLGACWSDFPQRTQRAVIESLPSLEGSSEQAVANVLWALGSMDVHLAHFDRSTDILACIDRSIRRVCPSFTAQGLSNCLLGLAKLGVQQQDLSAQTWIALQQACCDHTAKSSLVRMDPRAVSNVIWSLGVMQTRWSSSNSRQQKVVTDPALMNTEMSECLLAAVDRSLGKMTEQGLSMTLLGLAKMKVNAGNLNSRMRQKILSAIEGVSDSMAGQGISNCLWSLQGLGFTWHGEEDNAGLIVPVTVQQALFAALVREAAHLPPPTVSLCWNSFAKLGCVYQDLPASVLGVLEVSLESTCSEMTVREISNTIYGLGKMNRQFHHMSLRTQTALLQGLQRTLPEMDEQEVGIAMWGLGGQMGLSFPQMPAELQTQFTRHIVRLCPQLTCQSLTALFQGLSKVGDFQWRDLPVPLRYALLEALESVLADDSNNGQEYETKEKGERSSSHDNDDNDDTSLWIEKLKLIGNVMYSAGRLQLSWEEELKPATRTKVLAALARVNFRRDAEKLVTQQQLEPVLHAVNGMAKLKLTWAQLGDDVRIVVLDSLVVLSQLVLRLRQRSSGKSTSQYQHWANRYANLMWSLAQLNIQWNEDILPYPTHTKYIFACAVQLFPYMTGYEFAWSWWALAKWSVQFADLPAPLQRTVIQCAEQHVSRATSQELGVMLWAFIRTKAPISEFPPSLTAQIVMGMDMLATSG